MADLKTPPCNLGSAKFSSLSAEEVLVLRLLELSRNRFDLGFGKKPDCCDICILKATSFFRSKFKVRASLLFSRANEPIPDIGEIKLGP